MPQAQTIQLIIQQANEWILSSPNTKEWEAYLMYRATEQNIWSCKIETTICHMEHGQWREHIMLRTRRDWISKHDCQRLVLKRATLQFAQGLTGVVYCCLGLSAPYILFCRSVHEICFSLFGIRRVKDSFIGLLYDELYSLSLRHLSAAGYYR